MTIRFLSETPKALEPTKRAVELSGKLRFILSEIDILLAPKTLELSQIHAHFRIQTHDFILASYLAKAFKKINQEAPNILIDIKILDKTAYDKLDNGELEMIIGAGLQAKPKFMQKRLMNENLVCLLDKANPLLKNWTTEAIFSFPHIKSSLLDDLDDPVSQYGKAMGLPKRKIGFLTEALNLQLPLLPGSNLIAFLPESIAKQGRRVYDLEVKECPFTLPALIIRGMWHERHQNDIAHQWIREKIHDAFTDAN